MQGKTYKRFIPERQVHPELKNYYQIDLYRGLSDSNFFLLCVDMQTLELLHSLKEPKYYARWLLDNGNRISSQDDKDFVDYLWGKLQEQLANVVCIDALADTIAERLEIVGINDSLKELIAIEKYKLAAMTNGVVLDHYFDPARPADFAAKVNVPVDDLPTWDLNPTDGDVLWPNMESFQDIGENRLRIEEVPSVWIYDGWTSDMSIADMMADTQYETITNGPIEHIDGAIPMADMLAGKFERLDLGIRHLVGVFTRNGQITRDLPEEPFIRNPLTGETTPLHQLMLQLGLEAAWPTRTYVNPSVFTTGKPQADDPHSYDPHKAPYYPSYLSKILLESLKSGATSDILLSAGIPILGMTPAIPATPLNPEIPSVPFFAGSTDIWFPGNDGIGLADMLKLPEDTQYSYTTPIGDILIEYKDGKIYATIDGHKVKIYPTVDLKPEAKYNSNVAELINEVFKLADDDPNLRPDIKTHAQILNSLQVGGGGGGTTPDLSGIAAGLGGIKSAIEALELAGCCDDVQAIATVLETINDTANRIVEAIKDIEIHNTNILNTGETANIAVDGCITGGTGGNSTNPSTGTGAQPAPLDQPLPNEQPIPSNDVCRWVEMILDSVINVYEWLLWAVQWGLSFFGSTPVGKIVTYLLENKWFIGQLTTIGLIDPLPDEVVTVPVGTATLITSLVNIAVRLELAYLRLLIESLKLNKAILLTALCNYKYDATNLKDKINDFIESVVREFDDHKEEIRDLLQMVFENPDVMRKFLYQPAPQNLLQ